PADDGRSTTTMPATPSAARRCAVARPSPLAPPVTSATELVSSMSASMPSAPRDRDPLLDQPRVQLVAGRRKIKLIAQSRQRNRDHSVQEPMTTAGHRDERSRNERINMVAVGRLAADYGKRFVSLPC